MIYFSKEIAETFWEWRFIKELFVKMHKMHYLQATEKEKENLSHTRKKKCMFNIY